MSRIAKVNMGDPAQRSGNSCEIRARSACGVIFFNAVVVPKSPKSH